jgi:hypothetical protein
MLAAGQTLAAAREQLPNFDAYVPQMAQELQTPRLQGIARHDANVAIRLAYEEARARVTNSPPHTSDAAYSAWSQQNSPHAGAIQSGNAMQSKLGREAWVKDEIHRRIHHPDFDNGY